MERKRMEYPGPNKNGSNGHTLKFFERGTKMKEKEFQADLIKQLKDRIPDCIVLKNDANYKQGIPDLLILSNDRWAMLECKKSSDSSYRPNQEWYLNKLDQMSFARTISPENREEVIDELLRSLKA